MYYREDIATPNGLVNMTAENFTSPFTPIGETELDIWGRVNGEFIKQRSYKKDDVTKCGGIKEYLGSKDLRGIFYYLSIGQYLGFKMRAIKHFKNKS